MSSKFIFNKHPNLKGKHAIFAPSQSAWLRYDKEKVIEKLRNRYRTALGTEIHEFAASQIELGHSYKRSSIREIIRALETYIYSKYTYLSDSLVISDYGKKLIEQLKNVPTEVFEALKYYITDGVGFKMEVELPLQYDESEYFFGTADTLCFNGNTLRIHDFKSGDNPAHIEQLKVYAALFCLEYNIKPYTINIILRLYQLNGIEEIVINKDTDGYEEFISIIDTIVSMEKIARDIEEED